MFNKPEDLFILLLMSIPIVAIVGGIVAAILKTVTRQRQLELLQRERIAAIERGLDPSKLPPLVPPMGSGEDVLGRLWLSPEESARRQHLRLLIGGIVTMAVGVGVMIFFAVIEEEGQAWATGILPIAVAVGLLLSAWLVRSRGRDPGP